jgi:hypothetical protein
MTRMTRRDGGTVAGWRPAPAQPSAVVGRLGPFEPSLVGIKEADELSRAWHGSQDLLSAFLAAVGYVINPCGVTNHPLSIQALKLLPV